MRAARLLIVALAIIIAAPREAFASGCANPIGTAGDQFYNNVYNVMQYCNGSSWVNMGVSATGGIGSLTAGDFCTTDGVNVICNNTSGDFLPVANGGTGVSAAQGNGSKVQLSSGSTTSGDCVKFDASGNTVDTGAACASGGLPSLASGDIWIGSGSSVATAQALSGDCSLSNSGAITCTKTSGTAFGTLATATTPLSVANGGTALSAGTSGGVLYYSGTGTLASSGALTQYEVVLGGGAGAAPYVVSGTGTSGQVLTSTGSSTAPTWQTAGSCVPSGAIMPYAGSSAPSGWLLAYGQCVSTTTYAALYAAIGDTWTSTDGCSGSNFGIPDLRGRAAFGVDNMGGSAANRLGSNSSTGGISGTASLGTSGGAQTHVQTVAELAAHNHGINDPGHSHTASIPGTNVSGEIEVVLGGGYWYNAATITTSNNTTGITIQSTGSSTAFNITPPVMVLSYIIKQ